MLSLGAVLAPTPLLAAPVISGVSPTTVAANISANLSATVNAPAGIQACKLYVDLNEIGQMTVSGNTVTLPYTFTSGGSHIAFVFCRDNNGNAAAGPNTAIWASGAIGQSAPFSGGAGQTPTPTDVNATETSMTDTPTSTPVQTTGELIKLACPETATVNDPCHAVYYRSTDGSRHAFSNSKVFFTWYDNFDSVITVTPEVMGSSLLGKNVTYRPGVKLVKFASLDRVYAVAQGGILRWVTTEDVARSLYGDDWNTKVDDIPDTFYGDYTFGADITEQNGYDVATELTTGMNIESDL